MHTEGLFTQLAHEKSPCPDGTDCLHCLEFTMVATSCAEFGPRPATANMPDHDATHQAQPE